MDDGRDHYSMEETLYLKLNSPTVFSFCPFLRRIYSVEFGWYKRVDYTVQQLFDM